MQTTSRVGVATLLGVVAIAITGHANRTTGSLVMLAEMLHSIADTAGLGLLFLAIKHEERQADVPWVGKLSGYFLSLAALVALFFGTTRLIALVGGAADPVRSPFGLLMASSVTLAIVWVQLKLTSSVHHMLHSHHHGSAKASYFYGSTGRTLHQTHHVAKTELYADLIQAAFGVMMGLIALFWGNAEGIKYVDVLLSVGLGFWMLCRGVSVLRD